jgi:hypothetical protein
VHNPIRPAQLDLDAALPLLGPNKQVSGENTAAREKSHAWDR